MLQAAQYEIPLVDHDGLSLVTNGKYKAPFNDELIKSTNYDQEGILQDILTLYLGGSKSMDPTYSKGVFYKNGKVPQPKHKYDLCPQTEDTLQASAENLPFEDTSLNSIVFDPPFVVGHAKNKPTGIIGERFGSFEQVIHLWNWYILCLQEFHRILKPKGKLVFKCQDTVSNGKQWWSHIKIVNEAERIGFICKDQFILLAHNRVTGHNHRNQKHARKFHSYFLVLEKKNERNK